MKKLLSLAILLVGLLALNSCEKKVNLALLEVLPEDKLVSKFPVTEDELVYKKPYIVVLPVSKEERVTEARYQIIQNTVKQTIGKYGFFNVISDEQINEKLQSEDYKNFEPKSVADMIQLGRDLSASHVIQEELRIEESKTTKGKDQFKALITLTVITTGSRQVVVKEDIKLDSTYIKLAERDLKKLIQLYLPLKGYILETRGGHQVARISLGRAMGITAGRDFLVHKRKIQNRFSGDKKLAFGVLQKKVSYSPPIAEVEVLQVTENDAWVKIDKGDRSKIRIGQVVFSRPE